MTAWTEAPGGFGNPGNPRRSRPHPVESPRPLAPPRFTLPQGDMARLLLLVHHDEDVEIDLNGVLAARANGYGTDYEELPISDEARKALRPGDKNLLAVHCHQTRGGQYIDVGLATIENRSR